MAAPVYRQSYKSLKKKAQTAQYCLGPKKEGKEMNS